MVVTLLGTSGCHLCDIAESLVRCKASELGFDLEKIDIASSDELVERYGISIPVLRVESGSELFWPFDDEQVGSWFNGLLIN